ncbi:hypothetical protein K7T73_12695 [Bacillus badius]|uniref:hypothetical protein n=1 Tax=Bacillus badius TaxID=1455 RepID=UPI001CBFB52D|nr:hypothetical protein [Bacillus badius]UAT29458.1 hypothetical protein K7T73_12695 [Bacillus badius]
MSRTIQSVHRFLELQKDKSFDVLQFAGEHQPVMEIRAGVPEQIHLDYIDEEIGYSLCIHFKDLTVDFTEKEFDFHVEDGSDAFKKFACLVYKKDFEVSTWIVPK